MSVERRSPPRTVLVVAPFPPPYGGIATYAQDIWESRALRERFHLIRIDTSKGDGLRREELGSGRSWHRLFALVHPRNWSFLCSAASTYVSFVAALARSRPLVVHVHTCSYFGFLRSGAFLFLARATKARRVLHLHNAIDLFWKENRHDRVARLCIQWVLRQATDLVVLSEGLKTWVAANLGRTATVVWNSCRPDGLAGRARSGLESRFPAARGRVVILMLGGVTEEKGAFDLIDVIAAVAEQMRNRLLLVAPGRGEVRRARQLVYARQLSSAVIVPGPISDADKNVLLRGADIFVLPSYAEGQPIAILEAMAASLPVVATTVGSISEVVEDGVSGFLVEPGDTSALRRRIEALVGDGELRHRMGDAGYQRYLLRHTHDAWETSVCGLYDDLMPSQGRSPSGRGS